MDKNELEKKKLAVADMLPPAARQEWLCLRAEIDSLAQTMLSGKLTNEEVKVYTDKILDLENKSGLLVGLSPLEVGVTRGQNGNNELYVSKSESRYRSKLKYKLVAVSVLFLIILVVLISKNA